MGIQTKSIQTSTTITYKQKKHYVKIVNKQLNAKPSKGDINAFNDLYQRIKSTQSKQMTLHELLEQATQGKVFQVGKYEYQLTPQQIREIREASRESYQEVTALKNKYFEKGNKRQTTSLIVIDVDDDGQHYDPNDVIEYSNASGAYYTYSNGLTSEHTFVQQNAYRLIYELSEPVANEFAKFIEQTLVEELKNQFPKIWMTDGSEISGTLSKKFIFGSKDRNYYYKPTNVLPIDDFKEKYQISKDLVALQRRLKQETQYG